MRIGLLAIAFTSWLTVKLEFDSLSSLYSPSFVRSIARGSSFKSERISKMSEMLGGSFKYSTIFGVYPCSLIKDRVCRDLEQRGLWYIIILIYCLPADTCVHPSNYNPVLTSSNRDTITIDWIVKC